MSSLLSHNLRLGTIKLWSKKAFYILVKSRNKKKQERDSLVFNWQLKNCTQKLMCNGKDITLFLAFHNNELGHPNICCTSIIENYDLNLRIEVKSLQYIFDRFHIKILRKSIIQFYYFLNDLFILFIILKFKQ